MKTNLVDLMKVTPISKNVERQQFTPTRGISSGESTQTQQQSANTFNQTLENHQNTQKETSFQKHEDTLKQPKIANEEKNFTPVKEEKSQQNANLREKVEAIKKEISEEPSVEQDAVTLSTAVQVVQQETESGNIPLTNNGENETETKIKTLLSLLSTQTDLKVPKLEQYVSTMRDAGKSVQEILDTLKNVLEEVGDEKEIDFKELILKIVYPNETGEGMEKSSSKNHDTTDEKDLSGDGKATKKTINPQQNTLNDKALVEESNGQMNAEEKGQKSTSVQTGDLPVQTNKKTGEALELNEKDVETVNLSTKRANADSVILESDSLQILREKVNALLDQFNDGMVQKDPGKSVNISGDQDNTLQKTTLKTDLPDRFVEALSEKLNVSKEVIVDFFSSNLIPDEKLQPFIQSFEAIGTQEFIQNNEALLSQMKAFIKLHHHLDSGSKITLHSRSVTVETTVIKQIITNQFHSKGFSSDFLNRKESILFKTSQNVYTVEKLSVRFISKTSQTEASEKSLFKNTQEDFLEKASQMTKKVFQHSFKNGYETSSQRMSDLERFHSKANTNQSQSEHLMDKASKTQLFNEKGSVSDHTMDTKNHTVSLSDDKENKGTKTSVDQEQNSNQSELKSGRSFTDTVMKNEQSHQVRTIEQVYQRIKDMTQLMARQQTRTELATIKLNPPELGRVSLEIVKEGNKISILMQVETKEAQEILNKNSNLLAARLVNNGFELQKVTVQMEKYEEQGNNQSNQNGNNNSQEQQNENQDNNNENEYTFEEEYTFADLLKGGIEENAS